MPSFGFANGYRRIFVQRDVRGVQAQLLMLALAVVAFAPVLAAGTVFGQTVSGAAAPFGLSVAIGALLFGIGMQLAGGCGLGTLYSAGGGNLGMMAALAAAMVGSFWASLQMQWWQGLPAWAPLVLGERLGWTAAVAMQLSAIGLLWGVVRAMHRPVPKTSTRQPSANAWWAGPWPLPVAAVLLAVGNLSVLLIDGRPWSITWGFTLLGAKAAALTGWDPASSWFWRDGGELATLHGGLLQDATSPMDLSIMLGAFCAAALARQLAPAKRMAWPSLAAALLGGLLIGCCARIAFGCNICVFFSGVASSSLHG